MTGSFFLWQEISSCHRKFVPEIGNFFLWHEVSYPKFLSDAGYFSNISSLGYKIATKARDFWSYLKIATKVRDFCSKLRLRVQGFLARFLPPCPLKSPPGLKYKNISVPYQGAKVYKQKDMGYKISRICNNEQYNIFKSISALIYAWFHKLCTF